MSNSATRTFRLYLQFTRLQIPHNE